MNFRHFGTISSLFMLLAAVSCSKDTDKTPEKPAQEPFAAISITETGIDFAKATVETENTAELTWLCIPASEKADADRIRTEGTEAAEVSETVLLDITGLTQNTDYTLYVLAANGDMQFLASASFRTEEDVTADALVLADGFMAYDGLDEASGMYRTNIMMCSQEMGSDNYPYYDVLIYVYTAEPLERADEMYRQVPFGDITPFYTNGQGLTDMMYYIGQHVTDQYGEPNMSGSGWVYYDENGGTEFFVADDTDNTRISIADNGDGTYTVSGTLVDKTMGEELKFVYTDDKLVFSIDQSYASNQ